jgi:hypothetical protein
MHFEPWDYYLLFLMFFGVRFGMNFGIASEGRPFNDKRGECYHPVEAAESIVCEIFNVPLEP